MALRNIAAATFFSALGGLSLLVAPAFAQTGQAPKAAAAVKSPNDLSEAQMNELYCIYDELGKSPDADAVVESVAKGGKEAVAKAKAASDAARTACVSEHKWSVEQADVATTVATSAVIADVTEHELRERGLSDKTFEAVMKVSDKLSPADFETMLAMGRKKADEAALARVRKGLTDAGVPADKDTVEIAIAFLQGSMAEYDAVLTWVDQKFY